MRPTASRPALHCACRYSAREIGTTPACIDVARGQRWLIASAVRRGPSGAAQRLPTPAGLELLASGQSHRRRRVQVGDATCEPRTTVLRAARRCRGVSRTCGRAADSARKLDASTSRAARSSSSAARRSNRLAALRRRDRPRLCPLTVAKARRRTTLVAEPRTRIGQTLKLIAGEGQLQQPPCVLGSGPCDETSTSRTASAATHRLAATHTEAPRVGLEPTTLRLTAECSAN